VSDQQAPVVLPELGVHAEIHQNELPPNALRSAENWIMRDGRMRVRRGLAKLGQNTGDRPNGFVGYIDGAGNPILLMGTDDSVWVFADSTQAWVDLSATFTATTAHHTIFRVFQLGSAGGVTTTSYIQNGIDPPKKWATGNASVSTMGAPVPVAKAMMILADRMLVGNIVGDGGGSYTGALGPQVVAVSDSQNPEAGYDGTDLVAQLADTPGGIVAMQEIGNLQGVIYKTDAIYLATASQSNVPFTFQLKRAGISGPVSPRAVVTASDGLQYYLSRDANVMMFDGIDPKPLGRHIQRLLLDTWDVNLFHKAHGVYDDENRELVFYYVGIGSSEPNRAIKIRLDGASVWPIRWDTLRITAAIKALLPGGTTIGSLSATQISALALTLQEYDALGTSFLFADVGGQAYDETGNLDDAAPIPHFFETGSSDLGFPTQFKSMRFIDHLFTPTPASESVAVTLQRANYGEDISDDAARPLDISVGGPFKTFHRFPGRRYAIKMSGSATQEVEWQGSTATFTMQGTR
jgi:hypothetical protein